MRKFAAMPISSSVWKSRGSSGPWKALPPRELQLARAFLSSSTLAMKPKHSLQMEATFFLLFTEWTPPSRENVAPFLRSPCSILRCHLGPSFDRTSPTDAAHSRLSKR